MTPKKVLRRQLIVIGIIALFAVAATGVLYAQIPQRLGIGRYQVVVELPDGAGLYIGANVTYRGSEIGTVTELTGDRGGARAVVSLTSSVDVPADLLAEVHSMSAIGEQYIEMLPRHSEPPYLSNGSVIGREDTTVPRPVGPVLDSLESTLSSIGSDKLGRVLDESFTAVDGAGPDLAALVESVRLLAQSARDAEEPTRALIDGLVPVLDATAASSESIRAWATSLARVTGQLAADDGHIRSVIGAGLPAAQQISGLFQQLEPTLPVLLANLTSIEQVAVVYNASVEQVLVLYPPLMAATQGTGMVNADDPGQNTFFAVQVNDPPPCTTGFLPASERRSPTETDTIPTPPGLYCAVSPTDPRAIRGARNLPCMEFPGRRAATVQLCRAQGGASDSETAGAAPSGPVASTGTYDPATGSYIAPDGNRYRDSGLRSGSESADKATGSASPTPLPELLLPTG